MREFLFPCEVKEESRECGRVGTHSHDTFRATLLVLIHHDATTCHDLRDMARHADVYKGEK